MTKLTQEHLVTFNHNDYFSHRISENHLFRNPGVDLILFNFADKEPVNIMVKKHYFGDPRIGLESVNFEFLHSADNNPTYVHVRTQDKVDIRQGNGTPTYDVIASRSYYDHVGDSSTLAQIIEGGTNRNSLNFFHSVGHICKTIDDQFPLFSLQVLKWQTKLVLTAGVYTDHVGAFMLDVPDMEVAVKNRQEVIGQFQHHST